jgi:hypothetical protein
MLRLAAVISTVLAVAVNAQGSAGTAARLPTDGTALESLIHKKQDTWFTFTAMGGSTYRIEVALGSLPDSIAQLIGPDQETVVVENDNDPR